MVPDTFKACTVPAETPEPAEPRLPDAVFVLKYQTSSPNVVDVNNLLVTDPEVQAAITNGQIGNVAELFQPEPGVNDGTETEPGDPINSGDVSSVNVTETYSYTGPVDPADNSVTCNDIVGDPQNCSNFVGPMIARQMESTILSNATANRKVLTASIKTGTAVSSVGGSVTSNDVGGMNPGPLDCGATCLTAVDPGTVVTLTAVPSPGYDFKKWTGSCTGAGLTCQVTMSAARSVTATFVVQPKLTVKIKKNGSVTSNPSGISCSSGSCTAPFSKGSTVTLTATPTAGHAFVKWTGSCAPAGTNPVCNLTMSAGNKNVTANFN